MITIGNLCKANEKYNIVVLMLPYLNKSVNA